MLAGAMAELTVGDPGLLSTDVGPVIDAEARQDLTAMPRACEGSKLIGSRTLTQRHRARLLLRAARLRARSR
jgi:delta 1-pyrroline-5-carboxylate dehydrogenase